jgi:uncharacterized membrane protein YjjP (DUF1212 family)
MFNVFLYVSLCVGIILINLNTEYQNKAIAFVIGMTIGAVCQLIAKYVSPYLFKLKNKNL